jgi:hypothetical protein
MRCLGQRGMTSLVVAVVVSAIVLGGGGSRAGAATVVFQLTLGDDLTSFGTGVELSSDAKQQTLSFSKGFTVDTGVGAVQVGQQFATATLRVFDETLAQLATYHLSSVQITAVRLSGDGGIATQTITLSFKGLTLTFP